MSGGAALLALAILLCFMMTRAGAPAPFVGAERRCRREMTGLKF